MTATGPTVQDFFKQFPDDDACLDYLMAKRYGKTLDCPKCGKHGKFHRIKRHPAYECAWCGFETFPMVGTIFHRIMRICIHGLRQPRRGLDRGAVVYRGDATRSLRGGAYRP